MSNKAKTLAYAILVPGIILLLSIVSNASAVLGN
jgi:hypothetical protein